jgi:hypothetical protein
MKILGRLTYLIGPVLYDFSLFKHVDVIHLWQSRESMGREDPCSIRQWASCQAILQDTLSNVCINCRKWIIEEDDIGVGISDTSQGYAGLLATAEVDSLFTDLGMFTIGQHLKVRFKRTCFDDGSESTIKDEILFAFCVVMTCLSSSYGFPNKILSRTVALANQGFWGVSIGY